MWRQSFLAVMQQNKNGYKTAIFIMPQKKRKCFVFAPIGNLVV